MTTQKEEMLTRFEKIISTNRLGQGYLVVGDDLDELKSFVYELIALVVKKQYQGPVEHYQYLAQLRPRSMSRIIKVDEMRAFEKHFQLHSEKGWLRIGVVWECDRIVEQGQNSFLKTLEEPTPSALIILVTTRQSAMLPTIRSRCQLIPLRTGGNYKIEIDEERMIKALALLKPGSGAEIAMQAATILKELFESLNETAAQQVTLLSAQAEELPEEKKEREATNKALLKSQYLALRENYSSLIYTWFSQLVLLANGVADDLIPHGEFFNYAKPEWLSSLTVEQAEYQLTACQTFCGRINLNVKDEMLIDDFALSAAEKRW